MQPVEVYAAARGRVAGLVANLRPAQLTMKVPGTPVWSVHDVVAHLAGLAADVGADNMEGAPTDAWTARQVGPRHETSIEELLEEWRTCAPAVEAQLAEADGFHPFAADVFAHEHDLRGALGLAGPTDAGVTADIVGRVAGMALGPRLDKHGLPALCLVGDEATWVAGSASVGATVSAPTMELFRWTFGRRSMGQARSYEWDGDPAPFLPLCNLFGPPPVGDVTEAGAPQLA